MATAFSRIAVHVQPKAKSTEVRLEADGIVRVRVTAAPEGGKANAAVQEALARALGVARSQIVVAAGHASRKKLIDVPMSLEAVRERLGGRR